MSGLPWQQPGTERLGVTMHPVLLALLLWGEFHLKSQWLIHQRSHSLGQQKYRQFSCESGFQYRALQRCRMNYSELYKWSQPRVFFLFFFCPKNSPIDFCANPTSSKQRQGELFHLSQKSELELLLMGESLKLTRRGTTVLPTILAVTDRCPHGSRSELERTK